MSNPVIQAFLKTGSILLGIVTLPLALIGIPIYLIGMGYMLIMIALLPSNNFFNRKRSRYKNPRLKDRFLDRLGFVLLVGPQLLGMGLISVPAFFFEYAGIKILDRIGKQRKARRK